MRKRKTGIILAYIVIATVILSFSFIHTSENFDNHGFVPPQEMEKCTCKGIRTGNVCYGVMSCERVFMN